MFLFWEFQVRLGSGNQPKLPSNVPGAYLHLLRPKVWGVIKFYTVRNGWNFQCIFHFNEK